jgi:hypothetical protein
MPKALRGGFPDPGDCEPEGHKATAVQAYSLWAFDEMGEGIDKTNDFS